ncbi:MAG: Metal-dependent hydrolase of the beta-lactamase superfamily II [Candidatus Methanohalarchaeum thermophilum]|uniref:Metal-dependent hydrolase of the beta-lactamase superfamily II n=1 Tax=Methanohalarchaeum thermophilum TaxID=1903181 RepID=A0A1Q6DUP1_METT1|nr:MAG: Metal-dependent hydrolase of the beta-lactamase superfamily II [Candidatus Methanohalarchaeum thermophilum]
MVIEILILLKNTCLFGDLLGSKVHKINVGKRSGNVYLYNKSIMIDAGMNPSRVLDGLKEFIKPEDLKIIILTHCHFDHFLAASRIKEKTGAKIYIHEDDSEYIETGDNVATAAIFFGQEAPKIKPDSLLSNSDEIQDLKVIHTPGHTEGSICLYDGEILFTGDTVFSNGRTGRTDLIGGDKNNLKHSLKKLSKLDVDKIYPGHGEISSGKSLKKAVERLK